MSRKKWLALICAATLVICGLTAAGESGDTLAVTTISDLRQVDAASESVILDWKGTSKSYVLYQYTSKGEEAGKLGVVSGPAEVVGLHPGMTYYFKLFEADESGNRVSPDDPGAAIEGVRTAPERPETPRLSYWYRTSDGADFTWDNDDFSEGYNVRVETLKSKKLYSGNVTGTAVSGAANINFALNKTYKGRVAGVKVRGYITVDGIKKYGEWSEPVYYASAKKISLKGAKDTIKISGIRVKNASKKEIYISKKKKKGYRLAATLNAKKTGCSVSEYGGRAIVSDKTYHVRVYYYYKLNGKEIKSPVYDEGSVYVKPTYFYINV